MSGSRRIRVVVVEDSITHRRLLAGAIARDPRFEVVGTFATAEQVLGGIRALAPDVMTLDLFLPEMSGLELLEKLRVTCPVPTVIVSALGANVLAQAMAAGAVDVIPKPAAGFPPEIMYDQLRSKIATAARASTPHQHAPAEAEVPPPPSSSNLIALRAEVVAIGASTGGPEAIHAIMREMPPDAPPVLIAVHMPAGFTRTFAERLDQLSPLTVSEAQDGEVLVPGHALVAPGGAQCRVRRDGTRLVVSISHGERVRGFAPCVDVLFESLAKAVGRGIAAALLTGMGSDGADGMLAMRQAGARTYAQDEASSVVYGMPKAARDRGAAEQILPLSQIAKRLVFG